MGEPTGEDGVIVALLERFRTQRLPRALDIKKRVDQGDKLSDTDISFLEQVFEDAKQIRPILDRNPKYEDLAAKGINLYNQITKKALENEQN